MPVYRNTRTERSVLFFNENDGRRITVHIVDGSARADVLINVMNHLEARYQTNTNIYQDDAAAEFNASFTRIALNQIKSERNELLKAQRDISQRQLNLKQPIPIASADLVYERDLVRRLEAMPAADRFKQLLRKLTLEETSALLRHGDLARLTADQPEIAQAVEREHMVLTTINLLAGEHGKSASLHDPLASGVNLDAARATAEAKLAGLDSELEAVQASGRAISEIITYAAAACNLDPETLFAEVTG